MTPCLDWAGLPSGLRCWFLNQRPKGRPMNDLNALLVDILERIKAQDSVNQESLMLNKEVATVLAQVIALQKDQGEQLATIARWIASRPS